ncbi:ABC transporter-like protein [Ketogulonicigenium robustum]|uniref:ABC transporter-like protein n=1 Tax=Ketogulonicigenium robustum TaxID=92947 RepID=A0A1W6NZ79_9RHOB|nr:ABC transporter-like protein [Ketogulonicigenium robustum]
MDLSSFTPAPRFKNLNPTFGAERAGTIGRNGSGKSTLLRLIAGELRLTFGSFQATGTLPIMRQDVTARPQGTIADLLGVVGLVEVD